MKEYQTHFLKQLIDEIEDHLSEIENVDNDKVKLNSNKDLYHAQCAFRHIKFLKAFLDDIEKCFNS